MNSIIKNMCNINVEYLFKKCFGDYCKDNPDSILSLSQKNIMDKSLCGIDFYPLNKKGKFLQKMSYVVQIPSEETLITEDLIYKNLMLLYKSINVGILENKCSSDSFDEVDNKNDYVIAYKDCIDNFMDGYFVVIEEGYGARVLEIYIRMLGYSIK